MVSMDEVDERALPMTRAEAISLVVGTWIQLAGEFCCSDAEEAASERECSDVLTALGCTVEELAEHGLSRS